MRAFQGGEMSAVGEEVILRYVVAKSSKLDRRALVRPDVVAEGGISSRDVDVLPKRIVLRSEFVNVLTFRECHSRRPCSAPCSSAPSSLRYR